MAKLYNLVRCLTATTGTGTITIGAAVSGFLTFPAGGVTDGTVVSYGIRDGANSEVGTGTYSAGTLTRTPTSSTNLGAVINLSGSAEVYITARAQDIVEKTGDTMTGNLTVNGNVVSTGSIQCSSLNTVSGTTGAVYFGNTGLKYLYYDGTTFALTGPVNVSGTVNAGEVVSSLAPGASGIVRFGNTATKYLWYDGTKFILNGGHLEASNDVKSGTGNFSSGSGSAILAGGGSYCILYPNGLANATGQFYVDAVGNANVSASLILAGTGSFIPGGGNGGFNCKEAGSNGVQAGTYFNTYWGSPYVYAYINNTQLGIMTINTSDYRIKKDVADLPSTWDAVKALRPISYTHKEYIPPTEAERSKETGVPFFVNDDTPRWGFIAHEVQEALLNSAASAPKDDPGKVQSLDMAPIVSALTKALQEAMARIEALEAA